MAGVVTPILQWLNENPELAGFATFLISAGESVAIIGTIVPGTLTMTAIGALAGAGVIPLWSTIIWAILGAIVGDGISYWIGHYFKDRLRRMWPFKDNPGILQKGEVFVHKYGVTSVFIGRFVGPVRALVPVVAGMLGMKPWQFTIANIASAIGWAPAYMMPGILLGAASLELPPDIALHVILGFFMILLFFTLIAWLFVKILTLIHLQIDQMQNSVWQFMKTSRVLNPVTVILKHHDKHRSHGQLNLAVYFLIFSTLFLVLAAYVKSTGAANLTINEALFHLFRGIHTPLLDHIMICITMLGQKEVILPAVVLIFGYLLYSKHYREASHTLMLAVFVSGSIFIFKHAFASARPWGIAGSPESFSMPSGHAVLSLALYLGISLLVTSTIQSKAKRWMVYIFALGVIFAIGISRIYLGAHWFTDVLAAWLLGASILCFVVVSYERAKVITVNPRHILLILLPTLAMSYSIYYYRHIPKFQESYALLPWPVLAVNMEDWWKDDNEIPEDRSSLFGFPSQPINIQWVGSLDEIKTTLMNQGWATPPARNWISTLHRIADISSTQFLPMISPQYQDKTPELTLTKNVKGIKNLLVIRFWNSNRIIKETNEPLWVGIISVVPRTYNWVFKKDNTKLTVQPELIFSSSQASTPWMYKMLKINKTQVILIRPQI